MLRVCLNQSPIKSRGVCLVFFNTHGDQYKGKDREEVISVRFLGKTSLGYLEESPAIIGDRTRGIGNNGGISETSPRTERSPNCHLYNTITCRLFVSIVNSNRRSGVYNKWRHLDPRQARHLKPFKCFRLSESDPKELFIISALQAKYFWIQLPLMEIVSYLICFYQENYAMRIAISHD